MLLSEGMWNVKPFILIPSTGIIKVTPVSSKKTTNINPSVCIGFILVLVFHFVVSGKSKMQSGCTFLPEKSKRLEGWVWKNEIYLWFWFSI